MVPLILGSTVRRVVLPPCEGWLGELGEVPISVVFLPTVEAPTLGCLLMTAVSQLRWRARLFSWVGAGACVGNEVEDYIMVLIIIFVE